MKVVCCKNCGAKYQLEDNDDISAFECSSCAGDLEVIGNYDNDSSSLKSTIDNYQKYENSNIVQCEDCGLKYKINEHDNITDYECDSCGGSLKYFDNDKIDEYSKEKEEVPEKQHEEIEIAKNKDTIQKKHSITDKIESFFSESYEEDEQQAVEELPTPRTARTTISQAVLSKFGREFAIPKSNDYNVLKNYLKDEFYKGINEDYGNGKVETKNNFLDKLKEKIPLSEPKEGIVSKSNDNQKDELEIITEIINSDNIITIIGAIIFILSIIEVLTINSGLGIFTIILAVIILCYGFYKSRDIKETKSRTRIIREHLLTLPEEYYVFYNVKIPYSSSGINHVVIGPSGIYALISQKYKSKNKLESENENLGLINSTDTNDKLNEIETTNNNKRFMYTTKQAKFSQDDKIKQKSLTLGENLINFLNENNIKHCFVEPLVGFINHEVVVINTPLTDEDLFIEELLHKIEYGSVKLNSETIDKCAVLLNKYSADCSAEF